MFNDQAYLLINPDVAAAVDAGEFSSGIDQYIQIGQFEENRISFFFGSNENDTIIGFGQGIKLIAGVAYDALLNEATVAGVGEVDTLIGTEGTDVFLLGNPGFLTSPPQQFYVGGNDTDYALIQNFEPGNDIIVLEGTPENYNLQEVNGSLNISTASGELVGIVDGVSSLLNLPSEFLNITNSNILLGITESFSVLV